jgi:hypothetical protein
MFSLIKSLLLAAVLSLPSSPHLGGGEKEFGEDQQK